MLTAADSESRIRGPVETLPREQLAALQLERLRATVARVLRGQPVGAERLARGHLGARGPALARRPRAHPVRDRAKCRLNDRWSRGPRRVSVALGSRGGH